MSLCWASSLLLLLAMTEGHSLRFPSVTQPLRTQFMGLDSAHQASSPAVVHQFPRDRLADSAHQASSLTLGHEFPRLANCWGPDPSISESLWDYAGFPNVTNSTWGDYDVIYINPFDSCCYAKEMADYTTLIRAIKARNPEVVILATFHATEIWTEDLSPPWQWLPSHCLLRNGDGSVCSWWNSLVFTNNLFQEECFQAAVQNALGALPNLIAAGVSGVFLDGVIPFNTGCTSPDVNCTSPGCTPTPQKPASELETIWEAKYVEWFETIQSVHPGLVWVNNVVDTIEDAFIPTSNGRMFEGTDGTGLDTVWTGQLPIGDFLSEVRKWTNQSVQPSYMSLHMNSDISGSWRIGRWQNLATRGEIVRALTDFKRMRFGLGVALLTDGYFANDLGGGWYGVPSFYTEYQADLGHALGSARQLAANGTEQAWTREFEHGAVFVSSFTTRSYTLELAEKMRELSPSQNPQRLTGGTEAPLWQFVLDNNVSHPAFACAARPDWWAAVPASFSTVGNWTVVTDDSASHQIGESFLVSFAVPGAYPQAFIPHMSASWAFSPPATARYTLATTSVNAHGYPLTDGLEVCIRTADSSSACFVRTTIDQYSTVRDGRWQQIASGVSLQVTQRYEVRLSWNPRRGGYAAIDALQVQSEAFFHTGAVVSSIVIAPMDARVLRRVS